MKMAFALAGLVVCLLPSAVLAAPAQKSVHAKKSAAATSYQCSKCHMIFTALQAKKDHYKDPMDGGALVPVAPRKA